MTLYPRIVPDERAKASAIRTPRERNVLIATPQLLIGYKWQILCDLRIALAHDDTIADFEGHQVLTNLQRAAISFARSRHDIIDSCPRNLVAG